MVLVVGLCRTSIRWIIAVIAIPLGSAAIAQEPGVWLQMSARFLNAGFAQPVAKISPVDVHIKKYHVTGTAQLTGRTSYCPLPCENGIRLKMILSGSAVGCDTSQIRRICVHTIDRSRICVEQEVMIDAKGVRPVGTASISAPTVSEFRSATAGQPPVRDALVRSLARSQFRLMPARTNRIATEVSEIVLRQSLEHDLPETVGKANTRFRDQFLETLTGFEIPPENVSFSSTSEAIAIRVIVPETKATSVPPLEAADFALRAHDTVLNRMARQLYGGSTQIGKDLEADLAKVIHLLGGPPPGPASGTEWSITFSKETPIVFRFDRNTLRMELHGDEFEMNKEQFKAMTATIEYGLEKSAVGWKLIRHKPIDVTPPGVKAGEKPTPRQQVLRSFLATRLSQIFAQELDLSKVALPEALGDAAKSVVNRAAAQDGWILLELTLP